MSAEKKASWNQVWDREWLCSYEFASKQWSVVIWASTREEAEMKLRAVGKGKVDGPVMGVGRSTPISGRDFGTT